jgi:hypothetical protein
MDRCRSVGAYEDPGWLGRHGEVGVQFAVDVEDVGERQPVPGDEALVALRVTGPGDADDGDPLTDCLDCLLDRGGFSVADASTGCPEPEGDGFAGQRCAVQRPASEFGGTELENRRQRQVRLPGRSRPGGLEWLCSRRTCGRSSRRPGRSWLDGTGWLSGGGRRGATGATAHDGQRQRSTQRHTAREHHHRQYPHRHASHL